MLVYNGHFFGLWRIKQSLQIKMPLCKMWKNFDVPARVQRLGQKRKMIRGRNTKPTIPFRRNKRPPGTALWLGPIFVL